MQEKFKTVLRAQFDSRKERWKIVKKTTTGSGGWANFGDYNYRKKEDANRQIDMIIETYPGMYLKDK